MIRNLENTSTLKSKPNTKTSNRGEKTIKNNTEKPSKKNNEETFEDENLESEELEENEKGDLEKETPEQPNLKTKRLPDLDKDDTLVKAIVSLPKKSYKKLGELAFEKEVSRASIMREALKEYFEKQEQPPMENPLESNPEQKYTDEEINALLTRCSTYYGGFETMGDKGFFNVFEKEGIKLEDLTADQFLNVSKALKLGYDGFYLPPSIDEFIEYTKELEPTEDQITFLRLVLEHGITRTITEPLQDEKVETFQDLIKKVQTEVETAEEEQSLLSKLM